MAFQFDEKCIDEFRTRGFTVLKGILPPALIADLRRSAEQGRRIVQSANPNAQRFQPVGKYDIDLQPFRAYRDLAAIHDSIAKLLSPRHTTANLEEWTGVLLEPSARPWCTDWHRDWIDHRLKGAGLATDELCDLNCFNQINCALYDDSSTWFVPGSHVRQSTAEEDAARAAIPMLENTSESEAERLCLEYCQRMPNAFQVHLHAGDMAVYRNILWHIGNYAPYRKRATIHDIIDTPEYRARRSTLTS